MYVDTKSDASLMGGTSSFDLFESFKPNKRQKVHVFHE